MSYVTDDASAMAHPIVEPGRDPVATHGHLRFHFRDGPFQNNPVNEVIEQAIEWWSDYIDEVEAEIQRRLTLE